MSLTNTKDHVSANAKATANRVNTAPEYNLFLCVFILQLSYYKKFKIIKIVKVEQNPNATIVLAINATKRVDHYYHVSMTLKNAVNDKTRAINRIVDVRKFPNCLLLNAMNRIMIQMIDLVKKFTVSNTINFVFLGNNVDPNRYDIAHKSTKNNNSLYKQKASFNKTPLAMKRNITVDITLNINNAKYSTTD